MFFQKPVNQLQYEDIEQLVLSGEPESIALDYKASISGSDRDKAELAKDISAMANSQGGHIIIGVEEKSAKPVHPAVGIERMLGQQKVEEWMDQVLAANIAQRVSVQIRPIEMPASGKCITVIYAPMSPRAPHMVTCQGDNRYYRRYFKRHQFQSLPAEEYEVREMFERSQRFTDQLMDYLRRRGYADPRHAMGNDLSERLGMFYTGGGTPRIERATSWAAFVACPNYLDDTAIDTSGEEFWQYLDPNALRYPPDNNPLILFAEKRATLEGLLLRNENDGFYREYLAVNANGYVEFGCNVARSFDGEWHFGFVSMMGKFWRFLGFVTDFYSRQGLLRPFRLMLNMAGTKNSQLQNLGKGWANAFSRDYGGYVARTSEPQIQVVRELQSPTVDASGIEDLVRHFATKVDNAYGHREPRCYNHQDWDPQRGFAVDRINW